jgi:O-antigen/teichoic acid export membrane protein
MGFLYAPSAVGQYALAYRLMALPSTIIGTAIGQTYLREAAQRVSSPEASRRAFDKSVRALAVVAIAPVFVIAAYGPEIFQLAFGARWAAAGHIAAAMTPLVFFRFLASPISSVFHVYGRQAQLLTFQIAILGVVCGCMVMGAASRWSPVELILTQSIALAAVYGVLLLVARRLTASTTV